MANHTLGDLYRAKGVTGDEVADAVAAYLNKPSDGAHKVGSASLDIAAAIQAHPFARDLMANAEATEGQRRNAVRTAMLLAPAKVAG